MCARVIKRKRERKRRDRNSKREWENEVEKKDISSNNKKERNKEREDTVTVIESDRKWWKKKDISSNKKKEGRDSKIEREWEKDISSNNHCLHKLGFVFMLLNEIWSIWTASRFTGEYRSFMLLTPMWECSYKNIETQKKEKERE